MNLVSHETDQQDLQLNTSSHKSQSPHLQGLNSPQLEAVVHHTGPILILAGAGSGKTRVLTRRVIHLILEHGERPDSILAVTFTNKAAQEMKERLSSLLGEVSRQLWVSTFHSAGLRILRRHAPLLNYPNDFIVYDDQDTKSLMKSLLKDSGIDEKKYPPALFLRYIDQAKNHYKFPEQLLKEATTYEERLNAEIYQKYQQALFQAKAFDFGDLLTNSVRILQEHPEVLKSFQHFIRFVLVDEFQDTNEVQYKFVRLLTATHQNLLVVGDDDQSIYSFRGASISNILGFERDFPGSKVVKLEQNYRSTGTILKAAHSIIEKNTKRKYKKLWTESEAGSKVITYIGENEADEAEFIAQEVGRNVSRGTSYRDIAIFYRTNAQSRAIEDSLMRRRIPYRIYGGLKFYDRKEVKDIIGYLRFIKNPSDIQGFNRIINTPPRGIGDQTVAAIVTYAKEEGVSLWDALKFVGTKNKSVQKFVEMMNAMKAIASQKLLGDLVGEVINRSEYITRLKGLKDPNAQSRIENLRELQSLATTMQYEENALETFLDRVSLSSSAELPIEEGKDQEHPNTVSLMTLHLAKGLEFPLVFLTGLEEGLIPHYRSIEEGNIDEERRICYVGITRARKLLYLTRSTQRGMFSAGEGFGSSGRFRMPSRFLKDIPKDTLDEKNGEFDCAVSSYEDEFADQNQSDGYSHGYGSQAYSSRSPGSGGFHGRSSTSLEAGRGKATTGWKKPGSIKNPPKAPPAIPGLFTADRLLAPEPKTDPNRVLASFSELAEGTRVNHPSFGNGTILKIDTITHEGELSSENFESSKITIAFDSEKAGTKRLVYQFARLALA